MLASGTKEKHLNLTLADKILIFFASVQLPSSAQPQDKQQSVLT